MDFFVSQKYILLESNAFVNFLSVEGGGRWLEGGGEQKIFQWKVVRKQRKVVEDKRNSKKTIGRWWKLNSSIF